MYQFGEGVPKDFSEAARWYRKAADQGDAKAQVDLGYLYNHGSGVPEDLGEAAPLVPEGRGSGRRDRTVQSRPHV